MTAQPTALPQSRTVRRRRLGGVLRGLREAAEMTIYDAGVALECSDSRVSLIENGKQGVSPKDVREMAAAYGITDPDHVAELEDQARQAKLKDWWDASFKDVLPSRFETYLGLETDARELLTYSQATLHGLVQTADYARAIVKAGLPDEGPRLIDRLVALRLARQQRLTQPPPLTFWSIIDEAALRRLVGGPQVMRGQLDQLIRIAELPNVVLQVLPFATGSHASMVGPFHILRFPDPALDPDVLYIETHGGNLYLEHDADTRRAGTTFDHLRAQALDRDASAALITAIRKEV